MKNHSAISLAIVALSCLAVSAQQINVTGSAEVKVVPDEIYIYAGVETRDRDLQSAKQENDEHVAATLSFLKGNGVAAKDVKTDYINVQPVYPRDENLYVDSTTGLTMANSGKAEMALKPLYYIVRKSIGIKLTNTASFDSVLSGLVTNGVNNIQGVDFRSSELRKDRDKARSMAIQAAKEKAEAAAAELGVKLGKPKDVSENDWTYGVAGPRSAWNQNWGGGGGGFGGANAMYQNQAGSPNGGGESDSGENTIALGQISVTASVTVSFVIE